MNVFCAYYINTHKMSKKTASWYQMLFKSRSKPTKRHGATKTSKKRNTKKGGFQYKRNTRKVNSRSRSGRN